MISDFGCLRLMPRAVRLLSAGHEAACTMCRKLFEGAAFDT